MHGLGKKIEDWASSIVAHKDELAKEDVLSKIAIEGDTIHPAPDAPSVKLHFKDEDGEKYPVSEVLTQITEEMHSNPHKYAEYSLLSLLASGKTASWSLFFTYGMVVANTLAKNKLEIVMEKI